MNHILIAEDETRIAAFVEKGLRARGMTTSVAVDGDDALSQAVSGEFDLVILDLGLPRRDGFDVLRSLREHDRRLPVIVLTARDTVRDTVAALEGGADDYVTKPFRFEELVARIRAQLRKERAPEQTTLQVGDASLDLMARRLAVAGQLHDLTAREFALAELFFRHPGQVLSRQQILDRIWGYDFEPESNIVEVYVRYLRQKLGAEWITTVRGMGYRLEPPSGDQAAGT
jgi:two-component system, OmpR family, copper resistance phosphate regulon response regulator CusR